MNNGCVCQLITESTHVSTSIKPVRTLDSLVDDEIESCFNGSTNLELVKRLLRENLAPDGFIWSIDFGYLFAEAIEGFIDAEEGTKEWKEAWDINCDWGESIADSVNDLLAGE